MQVIEDMNMEKLSCVTFAVVFILLIVTNIGSCRLNPRIYLGILYQNLRWRLDEHLPGLFFTREGMCLDLRGEIPAWQNYRLTKTR